jgi:ankyrin repeat protein
VEVVRLLLRGDANVNQAKTGDGATPLLITAHQGHVEVVRLLLGGGANLDGWSPLFMAARSGRADVANLLLEAGANKGVMTTAAHLGLAVGSTALKIATDQGHSAMVALLGAAAHAATGTDIRPVIRHRALLYVSFVPFEFVGGILVKGKNSRREIKFR